MSVMGLRGAEGAGCCTFRSERKENALLLPLADVVGTAAADGATGAITTTEAADDDDEEEEEDKKSNEEEGVNDADGTVAGADEVMDNPENISLGAAADGWATETAAETEGVARVGEGSSPNPNCLRDCVC